MKFICSSWAASKINYRTWHKFSKVSLEHGAAFTAWRTMKKTCLWGLDANDSIDSWILGCKLTCILHPSLYRGGHISTICHLKKDETRIEKESLSIVLCFNTFFLQNKINKQIDSNIFLMMLKNRKEEREVMMILEENKFFVKNCS